MRISLIAKRASFFSALALLAGMSTVSPQAVHAADSLVEGAMVLAPKEEVEVLASDAAEDMLHACVARIPPGATYGQRLLAEQSCAREERARTSIQMAPTF